MAQQLFEKASRAPSLEAAERRSWWDGKASPPPRTLALGCYLLLFLLVVLAYEMYSMTAIVPVTMLPVLPLLSAAFLYLGARSLQISSARWTWGLIIWVGLGALGAGLCWVASMHSAGYAREEYGWGVLLIAGACALGFVAILILWVIRLQADRAVQHQVRYALALGSFASLLQVVAFLLAGSDSWEQMSGVDVMVASVAAAAVVPFAPSISRRYTAAVVAVAVGAAAMSVGAGYTYRTAFPPPLAFNGISELHGIGVDTQGAVYVTDAGNSRVLKVSPTGKLLAHWGTHGDGSGQFKWPAGIAVSPHDTVYVADAEREDIQAFSPSGRFLHGEKLPPGRYAGCALSLAIDSRDVVYVTRSCAAPHIFRYAPDLKLLGSWPRPDLGIWVRGMALRPDGGFYTLDQEDRLSSYSPSGRLLARWHAAPAPSFGSMPSRMAADRMGNLSVNDARHRQVVKFAPRGRLLGVWPLPEAGWSGGNSLALDAHGNVYVATTMRVSTWLPNGTIYMSDVSHIFKLSPQGKLLARWG